MNDWFGFCAYVCNHIVEHAVDEIGIWMFAYSPRDQHSIEAVYCRRQIYFACRNSKLTDIRQKKFVWFLAMKIPLYFVWNGKTDSPPYTNCISSLFGFLLQDPRPSSLYERPSPRPLSLSFLVLHGSCDIHIKLCFQGIYEQLHGADIHIYLLLQKPLSDSSNYSLTVSFFEAGSVAGTSPSWRRLPLLSPCSSGSSSRRQGLFLYVNCLL